MRISWLVPLVFALVACSASAREKAITATMATTNAAVATFEAADLAHQKDLATKAPDKATADAELAAWRVTQLKIETAIAVVYRAIALASTANDDPSLKAMTDAGLALTNQLAAAGVKP